MQRLMIRSLILCILTAATTLAGPKPIDCSNPPEGLFSDEWLVILINGEKCGYGHTTMTRASDTIKTMMLQAFELGRAGQGVSVHMLMTSEETIAGVPLAFATDMSMATQKVRQQGVVRDGKVIIHTDQYGRTLTDTVDYPSGSLMSWGTFRLMEEKGYATGTAYEFASYTPIMTTNQALIMRMRVEGEEELTIGRKTRRAIRTSQETFMPNMPAGLPSTIWVDAESHQMIKSAVPFSGMSMEMIACDRAEAMADFEPPEAFMSTLVKTDKKIDRAGARRVRMKLVVSGEGNELPPLLKTGMQAPLSADAYSAVLDVSRQEHAKLAKSEGAAPFDRKAFAEFLEPNIMVNSDDAVVRKLADQAAGDAKTPYAIADRLRVFVSERIEDKNLNIGFASASEVARNMSGDCSEHGVLLAAMGRAKGIPSRVVCGLVYVPWFAGADNVFGFHMWTQFYIDGQWVDFDAAQNETDCNPTHIALAVSSLRDSGLAEMAFAIFPVMSRLNIEIVEIEPAPK